MRVLALLLVVAGFSGCLADGGLDAIGNDVKIEDSEPRTSYTRTEGDVVARFDATRAAWIATQTVTLENSAKLLLDAKMTSQNGDVSADQTGGTSYIVTVELYATGDSQEAAIERLETMHVKHEDRASNSKIGIATKVDFDRDSTTQGIGIGSHQRSADIHYQAPANLGLISLHTSNGDIEAEDMSGSRLVGSTSNGDVTADQVRVASGTLSTTNGEVQLDLDPAKSGNWELRTTNGDVNADLETGSRIGYDIKARTTNGEASIEVDGTTGNNDDKDAHAQTRNFSDKSIQVYVDLKTTNGDATASG